MLQLWFSVLPLCRLYYLRGEIQLEAAKSSLVKYPFTIGSSQLFSVIHSIYEQNGLAPKQPSHLPPNYPLTGKPLPNNTNQKPVVKNSNQIDSEVLMTCQTSSQYKSPSDLLWDAMKWFQRAWTYYDCIDNYINASKAANKVAACHLEALYIPYVFFQKSKHFASKKSFLNGFMHSTPHFMRNFRKKFP